MAGVWIVFVGVGRFWDGVDLLLKGSVYGKLWRFFKNLNIEQSLLLFSHQLVSNSVTSWTAALQASMSLSISKSLPKFMSIESMMPSNHLILCRPLLLLPSIFPSIRVFSNESAVHIRWPKYWSSSYSISPSNEYSGLISFRMDWIDLLALQGTLKSFPTIQFKRINYSALSLLYGTTLTSIHDYWLHGPCWQSNVSSC